MPNHVTNILTFGGKREDIDELMLDILNEKDEVTFKKVCPQPYEIKNTSSPVRVVSNAEYLILKKQHDIKKRKSEMSSILELSSKLGSFLLSIKKRVHRNNFVASKQIKLSKVLANSGSFSLI